MEERVDLADLLNQYLHQTQYTPGQLAKRSGLPKATIVNWVTGRVRKPRERGDLLKLAAALRLDASATSALLLAAGQPTLLELLARPGPVPEAQLLAPWTIAPAPPARRAPFQALADLAYFVGREAEIQLLETGLLTGPPGAVYSIQGMGGVGKTALAARLAYRLRAHFPDGVLWARLDTGDPLSILQAFAEAYGRDVSAYPTVAGRSQVLREVLATKRALMILDNARSSADLEPLLPPTGPCAVLVTTRRHDLMVAGGLCPVPLAPFDPAKGEALTLFRAFLGVERVALERAPLTAIADLLGHLPLAVSIAASRLAYEPDWTATTLLRRLTAAGHPLNELVRDQWSVQRSFQLSYAALLPQQQQTFAALGAFSGEDFSAEAVAAATTRDQEETRDHLRALYSLSLVEQGRPGRYRLHPLLHTYARDQLQDPAVEARLAAYFVAFVETHRDDFAALDLDARNILGTLRWVHAADAGALLVRGVTALYPFLEARGWYALAAEYLHHAHDAARAVPDAANRGVVLLQLGRVAERQGDYARAETYLREALAGAQVPARRGARTLTWALWRGGAAIISAPNSTTWPAWRWPGRPATPRP